MPAISRSELERELDGLSKEMTDCWMSSGHWTHQTMGGRGHAPVNQTPPAPRVEASQKPRYPGSWMTSSQQCDGHDARMQRRMPKSLRVECSTLFESTGIQCREGQKAVLNNIARAECARCARVLRTA